MSSKNTPNQEWNQIVNFITSNEIIDICNDFLEKKAKEDRIGFNIFQIISDKYYREDLHSDFIALLLNPCGNHECGESFLMTFLSLIERAVKEQQKRKIVITKHYPDAVVIREYQTNDGRIDILVLSPQNKRAIVIENKINGAPDMPRQLPRYYDFLSNEGYVIDAIVYLTLNGNKILSYDGWSEEDKEHVNALLVKIPAYQKLCTFNLVEGFLEPSITLSNSIDVIASLRQYAQLIKCLNKKSLETPIMEQFYKELLKGNNKQIAIAIRDMLNNFSMFYAQRIADKFNENMRCLPFPAVHVISSYGGYAYFEKYDIHGLTLNINVCGSLNGYEIRLECHETVSDTVKQFKRFSDDSVVCNANVERIKRYPDDNLSIYFEFKFEEEQELFHFLDNLLAELKN